MCFIIQKTVLAVLDKLINPRWPYLPQSKEDDENQDEIQRALSSIPDDPMNYDFFYHILEADDSGRQPRIEVATEVDEHGKPINTQSIPNPKFNHKSLSCLRRIAESGNKVCVVKTLNCRAGHRRNLDGCAPEFFLRKTESCPFWAPAVTSQSRKFCFIEKFSLKRFVCHGEGHFSCVR